MRNKRIVRPTEHQSAILRRIARGKLLVTMTAHGVEYSYEDGGAVHQGEADKIVRRGWVEPESPPLFGEIPRSYVARKP